MHGETHARISRMLVDKRPNTFIAPPARPRHRAPSLRSSAIVGIGKATPGPIRIFIRRIHSKHHSTPISVMLNPAAPCSALAPARALARP